MEKRQRQELMKGVGPPTRTTFNNHQFRNSIQSVALSGVSYNTSFSLKQSPLPLHTGGIQHLHLYSIFIGKRMHTSNVYHKIPRKFEGNGYVLTAIYHFARFIL
jgi:hypothetical protein